MSSKLGGESIKKNPCKGKAVRTSVKKGQTDATEEGKFGLPKTATARRQW